MSEAISVKKISIRELEVNIWGQTFVMTQAQGRELRNELLPNLDDQELLNWRPWIDGLTSGPNVSRTWVCIPHVIGQQTDSKQAAVSHPHGYQV